jgi:hypothetical protein
MGLSRYDVPDLVKLFEGESRFPGLPRCAHEGLRHKNVYGFFFFSELENNSRKLEEI